MTSSLGAAELLTTSDVSPLTRRLVPTVHRASSATSVGHRSDPLEWISATKVRIKEFGLLDVNWDSYEGSPIALRALDQAYRLVDQMADLPWRPFVVSMPDGGVQFEWRAGEFELALQIQPSSEIEIFYSDPEGREWLGPWGDEPDDLMDVYIKVLEARRYSLT